MIIQGCKNIFKFLIVILNFYFLFFNLNYAYAVEVGVDIPGKGHTFAGYKSYVSAILDYSVKIGFALAVLMIIYAGIKYLTSQGNQTQINDAKEVLLGAIIGFVMLLLIDAILRLLGVL